MFNKTATSAKNQFHVLQERQRSVHQQQMINDLMLNKATNPDFHQNLQINRIKHELKKQSNTTMGSTGFKAFATSKSNPYQHKLAQMKYGQKKYKLTKIDNFESAGSLKQASYQSLAQVQLDDSMDH